MFTFDFSDYSDSEENSVKVSDTELNPSYNICLRVLSLIIYSCFLGWIILNIFSFVIGKKRYKDFFVILYYAFFLGLAVSRILQTIVAFNYIYG